MDRLVDRSLAAASFATAARGELPSSAQTVVIGAGIVAASVAYHLADADVAQQPFYDPADARLQG